MKYKKICFIMHNFNGGGIQRVTNTLARHFSEMNYQVEIMLTRSNSIAYELSEGIIINDCTSKIKNWVDEIKAIRKEMKNSDNTIFISSFNYENLFMVIANTFLHRKTIIYIPNEPSKSFQGRPYLKYLSKWLYGLAGTVVFQTEDEQRQFSRYVRKKSHIIMNPLKEDIAICHSGEREKKVVTACRLHKQKNLYMAIAAFEIFHKKHPDYRFEIYGEGELKESLQNHIKEKKLNDCIFLKGFIEKVHEQLKGATMFILSSDYEGIPNALMEAMAMGLPVISTDCPAGGPRELIEDEVNGKLVAVGDHEAMAKAMSRVAEDIKYRERLSNNAVKIRTECSIEKIGQEWEHVFYLLEKGGDEMEK